MRMFLKIARIEKGLSQKDLAQIVGVSQQTIAKWELGLTTPCHFKHLRKLEETFNKPYSALFPDIFLKYEEVQ